MYGSSLWVGLAGSQGNFDGRISAMQNDLIALCISDDERRCQEGCR